MRHVRCVAERQLSEIGDDRCRTARDDRGEWGLLALLSLLCAYIVYFRILAGAGATNVLLVTLLTPATAVILGALFLHERLTAHQFLGFALIASGLAFIHGRLARTLFGARKNPASGDSRLPIGEKSR
jgi:EamA domain-containing membrane protein RarD